MTPQEWLIKEYQRKETLLKQLATQDEEYVFPEELSFLLESVNMQPLMVLKEDHVCAYVCGKLRGCLNDPRWAKWQSRRVLVPGQSRFESWAGSVAIEIKVREKYTRHNVKQQKSTLNKSGPAGGKKSRATNGMSALIREQMKRDAVEQTTRNKMVLVILPSGKRRFMRLSEYNGH